MFSVNDKTTHFGSWRIDMNNRQTEHERVIKATRQCSDYRCGSSEDRKSAQEEIDYHTSALRFIFLVRTAISESAGVANYDKEKVLSLRKQYKDFVAVRETCVTPFTDL